MRRFLISAILSLFFCGIFASAAPAQPTRPSPIIDLKADREPITSLARDWRFHPGDDPRWASATFDDSSWKLIQPADDWVEQGYSEQNNLAWFRFRVRIPAHSPSIVLQMPRITQSYQLFADGQLIAQVGSLPPARPHAVVSAARVFTLPVHTDVSPRDLTLALRLWQSPRYTMLAANRLIGPIQAGAPAVVLAQFEHIKAANLLRMGSQYTEAFVAMPILTATLLLFFFTRQNFYLWFAIFLVAGLASLPIRLASAHFTWELGFGLYFYIAVDLISSISLALFLMGPLGLRSRRQILLPILLAAIAEVGPLFLVSFQLPFVWADGIYFFFAAAFQGVLLWYLLRAWRTGVVDARLFLMPYALSALISMVGNLGHYLIDLNVTGAARFLPAEIEIIQHPFAVSLEELGDVLTLLGFLAVLAYRFGRTTLQEQRLSAALDAARQIQHRLVPSDLPVLGGLRTEIAYLAAEEVGGDFCQVLPRSDGSVLIAIGDVSGKGLQAAMLGTLAVGVLRSLADEENDPCAILYRLNQVLVRTKEPGFVTCLCLRVSQSGEVVFANAGHLAPYLNGQELESIPGLPLGILPDVEYEQSTIRLPATARLTLLSDGVVEARSHSGELFGFDRTSNVSHLPASSIAAAAHNYGQQDDITVVTLDWTSTVRAPAFA